VVKTQILQKTNPLNNPLRNPQPPPPPRHYPFSPPRLRSKGRSKSDKIPNSRTKESPKDHQITVFVTLGPSVPNSQYRGGKCTLD
jgi:hypothetical protein